MIRSLRRQGAVTRLDLCVLATLGLLSFGLLLPATQQARQNADKTKCSNNLKQIILAVHQLHDACNKLPPLVGEFPDDKGHGTVFYHILPWMDKDKLYKSGEGDKDRFSVWNNGVYAKTV